MFTQNIVESAPRDARSWMFTGLEQCTPWDELTCCVGALEGVLSSKLQPSGLLEFLVAHPQSFEIPRASLCLGLVDPRGSDVMTRGFPARVRILLMCIFRNKVTDSS